MPMVLDALETINKGLRKVVDYAEKFLGYKDKKKGFKLLWEINDKGIMCVYYAAAQFQRVLAWIECCASDYGIV